MSEYKDFSSLPPELERTFVIYEKTSVETGKKAHRIGWAVGGVFFVLMLIVYFVGEKPKSKMAEDDMGMLKRPTAEKEEAADKPATPPADKPAGEAAAAPAAEGAAAGDKAPAAEGAAAGDKAPAAEGAGEGK